jgi:hypothetical protein
VPETHEPEADGLEAQEQEAGVAAGTAEVASPADDPNLTTAA